MTHSTMFAGMLILRVREHFWFEHLAVSCFSEHLCCCVVYFSGASMSTNAVMALQLQLWNFHDLQTAL